MREHSELNYRTYRGIPIKKEYSKVYFCSYGLDFGNYFEIISREIWNVKKTVVFWYKNSSIDYYENENIKDNFLTDLEQMQLFVIPVTYEFLYTDNDARLVELPFAIAHNIPVLPILQDTSLALEFNKRCGDLQALDKSEKDPTAISYKLKLEKFLKSVLISDELIKKIKESFEGYIFLSYRKKDRKLAQDAMKEIHSNESCRDIAIWYDEYLIPGENFNDAILEALLKSQLFVLVVTPQILEDPNYVMSVEYPMAWKYNKQILPVIAQKTDENSLRVYYDKIPDTVNVLEKDKMNEIFMGLFQGKLTKKNEDDNHLYYMGLAYLSGIDVEPDSERAISLLKKAAEKINLSAYEKLVEVYRYGIGVKKDLSKAIEWKQKLVNLALAAYKIKKTKNICKIYINSLNELTELYREKKEYGNEKKTIQTILNFIRNETLEFRDLDIDIREWDAYSKLCEISFEEKNIEEYVYYFPKYQQSIEKCIEKVSAIDRRALKKEVFLKECELKYTKEKYEKDSLDVKLAEIRLENTKRQKERADELHYETYCRYFIYKGKLMKLALFADNKEVAQINAEEAIGKIDILDAEKNADIVSKIFHLVGKVFINNGTYQLAETYLKKSIAICMDSTKQYDVEIVKILIDNYIGLKEVYYREKNFQQLDIVLKARLQICLEFLEKTKSVDAKIKCIEIYEDLGIAEEDAGNFQKGKEYFLAAYELADSLYNEYKESWAISELSLAASWLEEIADLQKNTEEAKYYYDKAMELDINQAYMELTLKNREGQNKLFNKILFLTKKLQALVNEPFLVNWLVENYNMVGEENSSQVNELFIDFFEELIKIAERTDKLDVERILIQLHNELAKVLSWMDKKREGREQNWIALQEGRKLLQKDYSEELAKEVLEICKYLRESYMESNLEEEWSKRISVIIYELELSDMIGDNTIISEIMENEFYQAMIDEAAGYYDRAEKQYRFLTVLIKNLSRRDQMINIEKNIQAYYGFFLDLLVINKCFKKDIEVLDVFGSSFPKYFNEKMSISIEQVKYYSYLGMARTNYANNKYKEGYQSYLFIVDNRIEVTEEMLKALKISVNILLEQSEYEEALKLCEVALQEAVEMYTISGDCISCGAVGDFCGLRGYLCLKVGDEISALEDYQSAVEYNEFAIKNAVRSWSNMDMKMIEPKDVIVMKLEVLLKIYREYNEILAKKGRLIKKHSNKKRIEEINKIIQELSTSN